MKEEIYIYHIDGKKLDLSQHVDTKQCVVWETCLRQIIFSDNALNLPKEVPLYKNREAYAFCLEIITGSRSRLFGETEVLSQFKQKFSEYKFPDSLWGETFKSFIKKLLVDVKRLRTGYLKGHGALSYGGQLKKNIPGSLEIHIVGSGNLCQEMLPWLADGKTSVSVYVRNIKKAKESLAYLENKISAEICIYEQAVLESKNITGALVIAAPVTSNLINRVIKGKKVCVYDMRDNSGAEVLESQSVLTLGDLFSEVEKNQKQAEQSKKHMLRDIGKRANAWFNRVTLRPIGWEELCF